MMNKELWVVLINCDVTSDGRRKLERIEGGTFFSERELLNALCYDPDDPIDIDKVRTYPVTDFMDDWNDTDGSAGVGLPRIIKNWFGYVYMSSVTTWFELFIKNKDTSTQTLDYASTYFEALDKKIELEKEGLDIEIDEWINDTDVGIYPLSDYHELRRIKGCT